MTAERPTHECKLYMLGIGVLGLLCESNTAFNATEAKTSTDICMMPCRILTLSFVVVRRIRYTSMASEIRDD